MNHGSLPPNVGRRLPAGDVEPDHRPDGLTDHVINALIEETGATWPEVDDQPDGPAATVIALRIAPRQHGAAGGEVA